MELLLEKTEAAATYAGPTADETAALLTRKLRAREPFFYLRYGDGALECMSGHAGGTCDGERYGPELGAALYRALRTVIGAEALYLGDWASATFAADLEHTRYADEYERLTDGARHRVHFEALLLMRDSAELVDFYRAVKQDSRRKLFLGPYEGAGRMLGSDVALTPMSAGLHSHFESSPMKLWGCNFEILLYGAGMAAHPQVVECWRRHPERTYINLGSALDPLFRGRSRRQQMSGAKAERMLRGLLK